MRRSIPFLTAFLLVAVAQPGQAQWTSDRPDGHAPFGVMFDHVHEAGEFMLSYRFMYTQMNGLRAGTENIEAGTVVDPDGFGFPVTPLEMPMQIHMFGVMFAPTDRLTLVGMVPIKLMEMDHVTRDGETFTTESSGFGDTKLAGLWNLDPAGDQRVHVMLAVGIPTGATGKLDATPMSGDQEVRLPYPMQTGTGTFDLSPGLTYLGQAGDWSWGGQAVPTFRLGDNKRDYRFGHQYMATAWGARRLADWLSASVRLEGIARENIEGADPRLDPTASPVANPDFWAREQLSAGFGLNTYLTEGSLAGLRVAGELLFPFYQDLDGVQLETDWQLILGLQYSGDTGFIE